MASKRITPAARGPESLSTSGTEGLPGAEIFDAQQVITNSI